MGHIGRPGTALWGEELLHGSSPSPRSWSDYLIRPPAASVAWATESRGSATAPTNRGRRDQGPQFFAPVADASWKLLQFPGRVFLRSSSTSPPIISFSSHPSPNPLSSFSSHYAEPQAVSLLF
ncbi:hypothetical protein VUR80DRAFT_1385 [Thermomyces stellatus]